MGFNAKNTLSRNAPKIQSKSTAEKVKFLQTLGQMLRFNIVELLHDRGMISLTQISNHMGSKMSDVSYALRQLLKAGIVFRQWEAQYMLYGLEQDAPVRLATILDREPSSYTKHLPKMNGKQERMPEIDTAEKVEFLQALGNSMRFKIVQMLANGEELCVKDINARAGGTMEDTFYALSRLLKVNIVRKEREAQRMFHFFNEETYERLATILDAKLHR